MRKPLSTKKTFTPRSAGTARQPAWLTTTMRTATIRNPSRAGRREDASAFPSGVRSAQLTVARFPAPAFRAANPARPARRRSRQPRRRAGMCRLSSRCPIASYAVGPRFQRIRRVDFPRRSETATVTAQSAVSC